VRFSARLTAECALIRLLSYSDPNMAMQLRSLLSIILTSVVIVITATTGSIIGGRLEERQQRRQLDTDVELRSQLLRSEIERHKLLPTSLASNPELSTAVDPATPENFRAATVRRLNQDFERLAAADGAATLYLIDERGITRVASNHRLKTSFIGQDYSFRPYFRDAMSKGTGELFAQGTVSGLPGLYLSQKLSSGRGVIVTKVEFVALERSWQRQEDETFVINTVGLVLLTSNSARRFKTYNARETRLSTVISSKLKTTSNWTLILLRDIRQPILVARLFGASIGGLLGLLVSLGLLYSYSQRARRRRQREELEKLVSQRTSELQGSNEKLRFEIDERIRTESKVQRLREELAQANRLATLGQISAGVAHEINQPAAAIRAYVNNIRKMLETGDHVQAATTLGTVDALTERIGLITNELREFSRRAPKTKEAVELSVVIDGALLLLDPQLRSKRIKLRRTRENEVQRVHVNRTRLEQVIVNLLQNSIDALTSATSPEIVINTGVDDGTAWIKVTDNGPGVPVDRRADLFAPFSSSKPLGLGLGLVICRDIVADYGGSIEFSPAPASGASFLVRLPLWNG
jgi:two-component system C4-dicarboxylate transport sensor histidine kinase DctB